MSIKKISLIALLFCIGFFVLKPSLNNQITNLDEHQLILDKYNSLKQDSFWSFFKDDVFGKGSSQYYRPVLNWSFKIDALRSESINDLYPFFLTNMLIHIVNSILLFILFSQLFKGAELLSFILALLFIVLPINVPAIAWIPGRNDSIIPPENRTVS